MGLWGRFFGQKDREDYESRILMVPEEHCTEVVAIVGESNYQEAINAACGVPVEEPVRFECVAVLSPEPTNPYDPNAVKVEIGGRLVGYLKRSDAVAYGQVVKDGAALGWYVGCEATINGHGAGGETLNRGVVLYLPAAGTFTVVPAEPD